MRWFVVYLLFITTSLFGQERILNYHVRIDVLPNADIIVEESIRVRAEGERIKRGIFRALPLKARDKSGKVVKTRYEILSVRTDAPGGGYFTEKQGDFLMLYVGDANVYLDPGVYNYTLKYQVKAQVGFFEKYDEVYWNVTGNEWEFQIDSVTAYVVVPSGTRQIQHAAYTGKFGETGKDYSVEEIDGGRALMFKTSRPLLFNEGLTVAVAWPKGYVSPPPPPDIPFGKNAIMVISAAGCILLLLYYMVSWFRVGKDPDGIPVIPLFFPPDNLSPAALRYIYKNGYGDKCLTSTIINLAVKGFLRINESNEVFKLHKLKDSAEGLNGEEKAVMAELFSKENTFTLKQSNYKTLQKCRSRLLRELSVQKEKDYIRNNYLWLIPGFLITVITAGILFSVAEKMEEGSGVPVPIVFGWSFFLSILIGALISTWEDNRQRLGLIGFGIFSIWGGYHLSVILLSEYHWAEVFFMVLMPVLNIVFYFLLKAPTLAGSKMISRIKGFKMYLGTAEKERLAVLHPPDRTPELFEKYLPYALALSEEKAWAQQFNDVLDKASREGYQPTWYSGNSWRHFSAASLAETMGDSFASSVTSYSSAPGSSSGSSGGGSSGGGGGGGGGGGW